MQLLKKYNTKLYKDSLEKRQINIDELGPEIVKKDKVEELDNGN